jgi:type II secretory pathway pseudopilin PulG
MSVRLHQDEDGLALITAMLAVIIVGGLALMLFNRAIAETRAVGYSQNLETAIHVAEAAADMQVGWLNEFGDTYVATDDPANVAVWNPAADGEPYVWDPDTDPDGRGWVLGLSSTPEGMAALRANGRLWFEAPTGPGEGYALRPEVRETDPVTGTEVARPADVILAVGAIPSFDAPRAQIRVLKLQVDQYRYIPEYALLTENDLTFGGSAEIVAPGCAAAVTEYEKQMWCDADVHTNKGFTLNNNKSDQIHGHVTVAGGNCTAAQEEIASNGCSGQSDGVSQRLVPEFWASDFFNPSVTPIMDPEGASVGWYDLCPPGTPDALPTIRPGNPSGPCTAPDSDEVWKQSPGNGRYLGWRYNSGQGWVAQSVEPGIFYVYRANASVTGSAGSLQRAVTILAEADPDDRANTGAISLSGNTKMQPAMDSVLLVADTDIDLQGNVGTECGVEEPPLGGFIGAGEQFKSGGTVGLRGAIVEQDLTDQNNIVQRNNSGLQGTMCLDFDRDMEITLVGQWIITYWNEL